MHIGFGNQGEVRRSNSVANAQPDKLANTGFNLNNSNNAQFATVLLLLLVLIQQLISQLKGGDDDKPGTLNPGEGDELDLPLRQQDAIRQLVDDDSALAFDGLATQFTGRVFDDNDDGQLSAGDHIEVRRFGGNSIPQTDFTELRMLTADDIANINTIANQPLLSIDETQRQRLEEAVSRQDVAFGNIVPRLDSVIDTNGDGQISVGDTLKISMLFGAVTTDSTPPPRFETLTQEQFDRFEAGIAYNPTAMAAG